MNDPKQNPARNTGESSRAFFEQNTKGILYKIQREPGLDQALVPGENPQPEYINKNKEQTWNSPLVPGPGIAPELINYSMEQWIS